MLTGGCRNGGQHHCPMGALHVAQERLFFFDCVAYPLQNILPQEFQKSFRRDFGET